MSGHFTATVRVTKSEPESTTTRSTGNRKLTEIASIVVRAASIEELRTKVGAHVALVDGEIGDVIQ